MSRLSDEMLNKYLDGELDEVTRKKIENQLEFSDEDRKNYLALKAVHSGLKEMKVFEVSTEFSSLLMSKVLKRNKAKKEQKFFIFSISSLFLIASLIIVGAALSLVVSSGNSQQSSASEMNNFISYINNLVNIITNSLTSGNISIVGFIFSFGIIISAYFFFDNLKQTRQRLSKL